MKKLAIIGAGLSGLYAASILKNEYKITVFEARDRTGGRVHTIDGFDLGPSWIWGHQHRILSVIQSLRLELFPQYAAGYALYDTHQNIQPFIPPPSPPCARMKGGIKTLIDALNASVPPGCIRLSETVRSITAHENGIVIETLKGCYEADLVLCTLPPRVVLETMEFDPPLPSELKQKFSAIPTWMGHAAKCVIEFKTPFWRDMGLSGFCFSHAGPLAEIHDACSDDRAALFGFVHSGASMEKIETDVRTQMERLFGEKGKEILSFHLIDWRTEPYSSVPADAHGPHSHPTYGLSAAWCDGRVMFAGTETAFTEGGYLEGAIRSIEQYRDTLAIRT